MTNDSADLAVSGNYDVSGKAPDDAAIIFIRQFARVYSNIDGAHFSFCILN